MKHLYIILLLAIFNGVAFSQCGPNTPTFTADLTGSPDSIWISPLVQRNDHCCGVTNPDVCVKFIITLDPAANAISFNIHSGAAPSGALFYQVNCGPPTAVGTPICLDGVGPHVITFCKPGNNENEYSITSIPEPSVPNNLVVNDGCSGTITAEGFDPATITWTSIFPGAPGAYNSSLDCLAGCTTVTATGQTGFPAYVDYQVCGTPLGACGPPVCRTSRVYFNPTLAVNILPVNPTVCFGQTGTTITANPAGGTPPYSYQWSTGATTQSIFVGPGTYSVIMHDASDCPPTSANITVTSFASAITANAGADQVKCITLPATTLNGQITAASGGTWTGGAGTFSPNNTTLNAVYTPTQAEINSGSVTLTLTTTGNGSCPAATDQLVISFVNFQGTPSTTSNIVSCFGGSDGSAVVSVSGAAPPYTFAWNTTPAQTGPVATNLSAGTYTMTVTDANQCTLPVTVTVTEPTQLAATTSQTNVSCFGGNNGTATVSAFGGTPGYFYQWSPSGGTSSTATGLAAGTYTVSIRDVKNCIINRTVIITEPAQLVANISSSSNVSCFGGSNGSASVSVAGGTAPYTYSWSPYGGTGSAATGLTSGTYVVNVTDNKACVSTATVTITQPATAVSVSVTTDDVSCYGGTDGSAIASASGGAPGYTYTWSNGPQSATINNVAAGTYIVTASDANGCPVQGFANINQPDSLSVSFVPVNTQCGLSNGSILANVSGGTSPYNYSWSTGSLSSSINNIMAGTYTVLVTDVNGCTLSRSFTILNVTPAISVNASVISNVSCYNGSDGSATVTVTGGNAPFVYSWSNGSGGTTVTGLTEGTYTVTVTDLNTCSNSDTIVITEPIPIILNTSSTDATCGLANGTASVVTNGGTTPYTYSWTPAGGTSSTTTPLAAGPYSVTVTDALGCTQTSMAVISNIAGPNAVIFSTTNVSCYGGNDGQATVSATGGTGPYTYSWGTVPVQTTPTATNLSAGVYTVAVIDQNGCQGLAITDPEITQPEPLQIAFTQTSVSCAAGSDGTATVTPAGGVGPYSYSWSSGSTSATATNLPTGSHSVTVTDFNGCIINGSVTIIEPMPLAASTSFTAVGCFAGNNGTASVFVSGGTTPYTYAWSNGSNSATANNLSAGTYNVNVTDAKGCMISASVTVTQPSTSITLSTTHTNVSCFGGSDGTAAVNVSGGTPGYSYSWSNGSTSATASGLPAGTHFIIVRDANGCVSASSAFIQQPNELIAAISNFSNTYCGQDNGAVSLGVSGGTNPYTFTWNNGGTTASINNLPVGNYQAIVTDSKGCKDTVNAPVIEIPAGIASITVNNNVSCNGGSNGSATANIFGGTGPFTYAWAPAGSNAQTVTGLTSGSHSVTITDSKGCISTASIFIIQPSALSSSFSSVNNVSCFGGSNGSATVNPSGGTAPYSYSWNSTPAQTGSTLTGVSAGTYSVTITDQNACTLTATVTITQPSVLIAFIDTFKNVSCFNGADGWALAGASGGTYPYAYTWNTNPVQVNDTMLNVSANTYNVTVSDSKGCSANSTVTLSQPSEVITIASADKTICSGVQTNLTATATGGVGSYIFQWSPGNLTGPSVNVSPTSGVTYLVTAFDQNGCAGRPDSVKLNVISLTPENVTAGGFSPICPGTQTYVYVSVAPSAMGPFTYGWTPNIGNGPGAYSVSPAQPTTYVVTVTNSCGVTVKDSVFIDFKQLPVLAVTASDNDGCEPFTVSFYDISSTATDSIISWHWNFGDGKFSFDENPVHTYDDIGVFPVTLSVVTSGGCTTSATAPLTSINVHGNPIAAFTPNPTTVYLPNDPVAFSNTSDGAVSYMWTFGDGNSSTQENPTHQYAEVGVYNVNLTAINEFGCSDTANHGIISTSDIKFPNAFTPDASGPNGGQYDLSDLDNDVFYPFTTGLVEYHLLIFNRWGELIFESFDFKTGWDGYYRGKLCQQDVYVWKASAKFHDGRTFNKTGDVTLLR